MIALATQLSPTRRWVTFTRCSTPYPRRRASSATASRVTTACRRPAVRGIRFSDWARRWPPIRSSAARRLPERRVRRRTRNPATRSQTKGPGHASRMRAFSSCRCCLNLEGVDTARSSPARRAVVAEAGVADVEPSRRTHVGVAIHRRRNEVVAERRRRRSTRRRAGSRVPPAVRPLPRFRPARTRRRSAVKRRSCRRTPATRHSENCRTPQPAYSDRRRRRRRFPNASCSPYPSATPVLV